MKISLVLLCLAIWVSGQKIPSDKTTFAYLEKRVEDGKLSEVENDLLNYLLANPKDAKGFALLAKLRLKQNRLNEAKSLLNKAISLDPILLSARLTLALVELQSGETEKAREILSCITESEISDVSSRFIAAEASALVGDCPRALILAENLPLKIKNGEAVPFRAACYLESGDTKNFSLLIPITRTLAKQNPAVAVKLAVVLSKAARHKETADVLRLVIFSAPQNTEALILLAKSEIILKDFSNAKIHLGLAEKIQPTSAELLFVQSLFEGEQGNNARSLEFLERSLAVNPDNIQALARFVVLAIRANQTGKAVRAAEKLIDLQPENFDFLYLYGAASLQNSNLQKAEKSLTKFLEARPNDSLGCLALGLTFAAQTDKLPEARVQMEKCLVINPNNYESAYQLGLLYKVQGETAKAIEYLEQTVRLAPDYATALRDLGALYLQSGGETKARPVLEKAVLLNPDDADTHFQLSRLYNLMGERELGKKHLELFQKLKNAKRVGM